MIGEVAYVGRSSMEIAIEMTGVETKKKLLSGSPPPFLLVYYLYLYIILAQFTMVARDEYNKAFKVPGLECSSEAEIKRREIVLERLNLRKKVPLLVFITFFLIVTDFFVKRATESLLHSPPTPEERLVIHKLIYSDRKALEQMDKVSFSILFLKLISFESFLLILCA